MFQNLKFRLWSSEAALETNRWPEFGSTINFKKFIFTLSFYIVLNQIDIRNRSKRERFNLYFDWRARCSCGLKEIRSNPCMPGLLSQLQTTVVRIKNSCRAQRNSLGMIIAIRDCRTKSLILCSRKGRSLKASPERVEDVWKHKSGLPKWQHRPRLISIFSDR